MLDPRLGLREMSQAERAVWDWLRAEGLWKVQENTLARMARGEPLEVSRLRFGGHGIPRGDSWPAWLQPGSDVRLVRVHADDTVEPAEDAGYPA